jgi:hypothetical protein
MKMNWEKLREFVSQDGLIYNNSFSFLTTIIFWDIRVYELTPIFNSLTHLSWQTVQKFQRFVSIFGQVVDFDLLRLGESILYKLL